MMELQKLKIVGNGHPSGAKVFLDGVQVPNVCGYSIDHRPGHPPVITLSIRVELEQEDPGMRIEITAPEISAPGYADVNWLSNEIEKRLKGDRETA